MSGEPSSLVVIVLAVVLVNLLIHFAISVFRGLFQPSSRVDLEAMEYDYRRYLALLCEFRKRLSKIKSDESPDVEKRQGPIETLLIQAGLDWSSTLLLISLGCFATCGAILFANYYGDAKTSVAVGLSIFLGGISLLTQIKSRRLRRLRKEAPQFLGDLGDQIAIGRDLPQAFVGAASKCAPTLGIEARRCGEANVSDKSYSHAMDSFAKRTGISEVGGLSSQFCCSGPQRGQLSDWFYELASLTELGQRIETSRTELGFTERFQAGFFLSLPVFCLSVLLGFDAFFGIRALNHSLLFPVLTLVLGLGLFWFMKIPRFTRTSDVIR